MLLVSSNDRSWRRRRRASSKVGLSRRRARGRVSRSVKESGLYDGGRGALPTIRTTLAAARPEPANYLSLILFIRPCNLLLVADITGAAGDR